MRDTEYKEGGVPQASGLEEILSPSSGILKQMIPVNSFLSLSDV